MKACIAAELSKEEKAVANEKVWLLLLAMVSGTAEEKKENLSSEVLVTRFLAATFCMKLILQQKAGVDWRVEGHSDTHEML